jgi:glyoxylase-like metal-dependent hydrolase (beta-lactamase superfamily II)
MHIVPKWLAVGIVGLVLLVCTNEGLTQQPAQPPKRDITKIAGDLYRFQNNFHYSVFLVTPAGIIVTDPIDAEAAKWLKAELAQRFKQPIKYLIYSHDHRDHIAGGEVFADTAIVVAHENAKAAIVGEKRPTAVPNVTFSDSLTIELGGKTVELTYVGRNHSDNSIVMRFPAERVLFAVDFIPVKAVAFRDFPDAYITDWIESLKRVEAMDYDILAPGHGALGSKEDVRAFRGYMEDLHAAVLEASRAGKSVDEMKQTIKLDKYKDWFRYEEFLPLNIEGMYRRVNMNRLGN